MQARKAYHNHVTTWHVPCNRGDAADYGGPRAPPCPKQQLNAFRVHEIAGRNRANRFAPRGKIFGATPISGERLIGRFSLAKPEQIPPGHGLVRESRGQKGLEQKSIADMQSIFEPRVASIGAVQLQRRRGRSVQIRSPVPMLPCGLAQLPE
jgi:hypothetical protein